MKEKLNNTKKSKANLYRGLSIAGITTMIVGGCAGIAGSIANIAVTKEKNLGIDYGQGLNFSLQFSLNDPDYDKPTAFEDMMSSLQKTADSLSNKLFKSGLKQIKLVPHIKTDKNINNNLLENTNKDLKNVYGYIDIVVDEQQATNWHLDQKIQEVYVKLCDASGDIEKQNQIIDDYLKETDPDEVNARNELMSALARNTSQKINIYFQIDNSAKSTLAANNSQPILNNTNILELQSVDRGTKKGTNTVPSDPTYKNALKTWTKDANGNVKVNNNTEYQGLNNNEDTVKLVQLDDNGNKTINFELTLPESLLFSIDKWKPVAEKNTDFTGLAANDDKQKYINLSGFVNQFNKEYKWEEHNKDNSKDEWKTFQDAVDGNKEADSNFTKKLSAPQASWTIWTNRSGLISRLNYLALVAYMTNLVNSYENVNTLNYEYWKNLVGDPNPSYKFYKGDDSKPITGALINDFAGNDEEMKYYYWVRSRLTNGDKINNFMFSFDDTTENDVVGGGNLTHENDRLIRMLNDFYTDRESFPGNEPEPEQPTREAVAKSTNYDWLSSWNWSGHTLINSYGNVIDYNNFFLFFDVQDLNDVFGENKLKNYNEKAEKGNGVQITKYNTAFATKICYNTNEKTLSDAQSYLDYYSKFVYGDEIINVKTLDTIKYYEKGEANTANPLTKDEIINKFNDIYTNFASLSNVGLSNSVLGLNPWTSTMIGLSVIVLFIGIIVSIIYRVPGLFATVTTFLAGALSIIIYRGLGLTFSFDTSIAVLAGIFIGFLTITNFLSYIPRLLKDKNMNVKAGILYSFKYFIRNSVGIHVTAIIIALVFLYFGQFQIQGFGAMLVINTLLSLLFNVGIFVGFISLLVFMLIPSRPSLMFSFNVVEYLRRMEVTGFDSSEIEVVNPWYCKFAKKATYNNWWTWVVASIIVVLSIVGISLLVAGIDPQLLITKGTYTITVLDDKALPYLTNLNINVVNNTAEINVALLNNDVIKTITNSGLITISQASPYIADMVVKSLVHTCLIAMGFCLIWSILWLNIVNVLNVFVVQLLSLITFGSIGLFQLPIDINLIIMISLAFLINNLMIYSNFINLRFDYQTKANWSKQEIKSYVYNNQFNNITIYLLQYFAVYYSMLLLMMFVSSESFVSNLMVVINCVFNAGLIFVLIPFLFMGMMMAREKYVIAAANNHKKHENHINYDKVDEQEIVGINKHNYRQI